jgi:DHA1 family inner membrane transport protein
MIVGAPSMALLTLRLPRRLTLTLALAVFALGHVIVALTSNTPVLLGAWFLTAVATGAFWAVASVVAAQAAGRAASLRAPFESTSTSQSAPSDTPAAGGSSPCRYCSPS